MATVDDHPSVPDPRDPGPWSDLLDELDFLVDSDARTCVSRASAALAEAREAGDHDAEMRLSYYAAYAHHLLGHDASALEAAARTEELAQARDEPVWRARALACRGLVHHELGDVEDAVDLLTSAVELRREAGDPTGAAETLNALGAVYSSMPPFAPEAAQVLTDARRLWLRAGDPDRASMALTNLAKTYVATSARLALTNPRGARTAARHALGIARQAVDEADAAGLSRTGLDARLAVVGAHMVADDLEHAGEALEATRQMLARFPSPRQQLAVHRVRGSWLVRSGRADEAVLELCDGLDLSDELGRPGERIELLRSLVEAHENRGDTDAALRTMHELYERTVEQHEAVAERRAVLLSSRLELERAQRLAEAERRRAIALEERNARLAHEAMHDALTGLANRRALDTALETWTTERPVDFAVVLVDIDHFKPVNDRWSHQVGDQVLARIGTVLRESVRSRDLAARYGGEEFALLLYGVDAAAAVEACERIRTAIAQLTWEDLMPGHQITVSLGVTTETASCDVGSLLARADSALYEAKATGRNKVCLAVGPLDRAEASVPSA